MPTIPTPIASSAGVVHVTHRTDEVRLNLGLHPTITLEPSEAARLGEALKVEAQNAIHAERVTRRSA
jgi:hypothetical protein